jgi:hypothetical protein
MERPEYSLQITVNSRQLNRVVIDQHYKENHSELNDQIILELVKELNGKTYDAEAVRGNFEYFRVEPLEMNAKPYRLIFLLCIGDDFLGVVNAFRVRE